MSYMDRTKFRKVESAKVEQRGEMRHPVTLQRASSKNADGIDAHLVDLSSYGCRIEVAKELRTGTKLRLALGEGQQVSAVTVWAEKGQIGCRFEKAIDIGLFRSVTINA